METIQASFDYQMRENLMYVLRAATFVILSVSFVARIYGESVGQSTKPSNGLIAFADAPDQRPGPQATQYAQIYTITPDGRNRKQLTTGKPGNFFLHGHQAENSWHLFLYEIGSVKSGL